MPDDHSDVVPLLPIPNRTVKRLSADDSAGSRVKVGHRQALTALDKPQPNGWGFSFWGNENAFNAFFMTPLSPHGNAALKPLIAFRHPSDAALWVPVRAREVR